MIELPFPPSKLNPNKKSHWAVKSKLRKKQREETKLVASRYKPLTEFSIKFHPPDKRIRDIDNAIASIKGLIDGLSDAWCIDDSKFLITYPRAFCEPVKGGKVVIEWQE